MNMTTKNTILHPYFEQLSEYTQDDFWKAILLDAAMGKFTRSVWYNSEDNILMFHASGNSRVHISLSDIDPNTATKRFIEAHQVLCKLKSPTDIEKLQTAIADLRDNHKHSTVTDWANVRSQVIRDSLVSTYAAKLVVEHDLPVSAIKTVARDILFNIAIGYIHKKSIHMVNGEIDSIDGLTMNGTRVFVTAPIKEKTSKVFQQNKKSAIPKVADAWMTYLTTIQ